MIAKKEVERACTIAFETSGFLITADEAQHLLLVPCSKREQLTSRLSGELSSRHAAFSQALSPLESLLSEFLKLAACQRVLSDLSSLPLRLAKDLRLSDVKTEVLVSWLAEIESSDSSSQKENNCGPEIPTPGSAETVSSGIGSVTEGGA